MYQPIVQILRDASNLIGAKHLIEHFEGETSQSAAQKYHRIKENLEILEVSALGHGYFEKLLDDGWTLEAIYDLIR